MKFLKQNRKGRRIVNFVPDWQSRSGFGRLESRALAAPTIFRRPASDPGSAGDIVTAWTVTGLQSAIGDGSASNDNGGTAVWTSRTAVVDSPNTAGPSTPPVGTGAVSFTASVNATISSPNGIFVWNAGGHSVNRNYVIADTSPSGNTDAYVRQTFNFSFSGSGAIALTGGLTTPGLVVNVGLNGVQIAAGTGAPLNLNSSTVNTGWITTANQSVQYSASFSSGFVSVSVTDIQAIGAIPGAGVDAAGRAIGVPWRVQYFDAPGTTTMGNTGVVTHTSYTMEVFDNPPS